MVAGACAIVRQMISACSTQDTTATASLVKAILINAAGGRNPGKGFGLINLDRALQPQNADYQFSNPASFQAPEICLAHEP